MKGQSYYKAQEAISDRDIEAFKREYPRAIDGDKYQFKITQCVKMLLFNVMYSLGVNSEDNKAQFTFAQQVLTYLNTLQKAHPERFDALDSAEINHEYNKFMIASSGGVNDTAQFIVILSNELNVYDINQPGPDGRTPLMAHALSSINSAKDLESIILAGADVHITHPENGQALHQLDIFWPAARALDKLAVLLAHGADPDAEVLYKIPGTHVATCYFQFKSFNDFLNTDVDRVFTVTDPNKHMQQSIKDMVAKYSSSKQALSSVASSVRKRQSGGL